jgi:hypothetical protein
MQGDFQLKEICRQQQLAVGTVCATKRFSLANCSHEGCRLERTQHMPKHQEKQELNHDYILVYGLTIAIFDGKSLVMSHELLCSGTNTPKVVHVRREESTMCAIHQRVLRYPSGCHRGAIVVLRYPPKRLTQAQQFQCCGCR